MAKAKFKQKCALCKTEWVIMFSHRQFPICVKCHMKKISEKVEDKKFDFLNIPNSLYEQSSFLRNIKESYQRFKNLTDKQIEAFKKTVEDIKAGKNKETED